MLCKCVGINDIERIAGNPPPVHALRQRRAAPHGVEHLLVLLRRPHQSEGPAGGAGPRVVQGIHHGRLQRTEARLLQGAALH